MTLFLLDRDYEPSEKLGREWETMLPGCLAIQFDNERAPSRLVDKNDHPVEAPEDGRHLVVVHRSSIEKSDVRIQLVRRLNIPVLIISREGGQPGFPGLPEGTGCYYRRAGVKERREGLDTKFSNLFADFWKKYQETGELDWANLEPEPWPRNLVAVYLVARSAQLGEGTRRAAILAGWNGMERGRKEGLWRKAFQEYRERGGSPETWKAAGMPDVAQEGGLATADFKEQQIVSAVEAIQSVLTDS